MDRLNNYTCRKAETKQIILGGNEDGFSPDGIEESKPGTLLDFYANKTGSSGGIRLGRDYDDSGFDQIFLDRFHLPKNTAHGIFVIRAKQLGSINNDIISLGNLEKKTQEAHFSFFAYSNPNAAKGWKRDGEIFSGAFGDFPFLDRMAPSGDKLPQTHETLLDYIRNGNAPIDIQISDDTMVDVIGFALCTEPDKNFGNTFLVTSLGENLLSLDCNHLDGSGDHCERYKGDTSCETELPLACFADRGAPPPQYPLSREKNFSWAWSGGEVKFTLPIPGDSFKTQADIHRHCRAEFGNSFRAANIHDGSQSTRFIAKGSASNIKQAWVDSNLEPYGNCWSMKRDYPNGASDE